MIPTIGRIVHYHPSENDTEARHNGHSGPCPALITRVWGDSPDATVNLTVFPDYSPPVLRSSVAAKSGADAAFEMSKKALASNPNFTPVMGSYWTWPPKV